MAATADRPVVTMDALARAMSVAELAVAADPEVAVLLCDPDPETRRKVRRLALMHLVESEAFEAHASPPWSDTWPTPSVRLTAEEVGRLVDRGHADAVGLYLRPWKFTP